MKKLLFSLLALTLSLPAFACDEDDGQGQAYSTGYYLKKGKLTKSKVKNCSNGMQEQDYTFENGVMVSFISINRAMVYGDEKGDGYETSVSIDGKDAVKTQRLKGIPASFEGQCYKLKLKQAKGVYCI